MITRDWLNAHIPVDDELPRIAAHAFENVLNRTVENFDDALQVLTALADLVEKDRWYGLAEHKPAWMQRDHPDYENECSYNISIRGLTYKESMSYLTAEGWYSGSPCWFITVDYGWKEYIAHETPKGALLRTIIILSAIYLSREQPPKKRKKLGEYVAQVMEAGRAAGAVSS